MKTISYNIYSIDELSDEAYRRAIDTYRDGWEADEEEDTIYEAMEQWLFWEDGLKYDETTSAFNSKLYPLY